MQPTLVLHVTAACKATCEPQIAHHTPEMNDTLVRIGLCALHYLRQVHPTTNDDALVQAYEARLKDKDQEQTVFERLLLANQDRLVEQRLVPHLEQVAKLERHVQALEDAKTRLVERTHADLMRHQEEAVRLREQLAASEQLRDMHVQAAVDTKCADLKARVQALELECLQQQQRAQDTLTQTLLDKERLKTETLDAHMKLQQTQLSELREALVTKASASSVGLGQQGERYFQELAMATFGHLDVFELKDMTKTPHSGDFHCAFDAFTVLCDTKNFVKGRVSTHDVGKFHFDMSYNGHVKVGWLICLTGYVAGYARRPFVFELRDGNILCYINNLQNQDDPGKLLLDVHYACEFMYHTVLNTEAASDELNKYKKYAGRVNDGLKRALKSSKRAVDTATQVVAELTEHHRGLTELLQDDILSVRQSDAVTVEAWLGRVLVPSEGGKIRSNALFERFKTDTDLCVMTVDAFKTVLKSVLPADNLQLPKHDKSQYVVLGYTFA